MIGAALAGEPGDLLPGFVVNGLLADFGAFARIEGLKLIERLGEQTLSAADATSMAIIRRLDIDKTASFDKHYRIVLTEREVVGSA